MNDVEKHAVFFIADISGYTKFIFSNEKEISHSQMVIRELITTLLEEVNLPLQLVRIEGDAIFLYAIKDDSDPDWEQMSKDLVINMMTFFRVFTNKVSELTIHKVCNCTACINIEGLGDSVFQLQELLSHVGGDTHAEHGAAKLLRFDDHMCDRLADGFGNS